MVDRQGHIQDVFVGTAERIYLPDIGRQRGGHGHLLRGLRHIHTVLGEQELALEDLSDLTKLRLDLVGALRVSEEGAPDHFSYAHLNPGSPTGAVHRERVASVHDLTLDLKGLVDALEEERARSGTVRQAAGDAVRAIVVGVYRNRETAGWREAEIRELASTAGVAITEIFAQFRARPDPKYVVGKGKLEQIVLAALDVDAELVVFDHDLSPAQARAIAAFSDLKVIDRTQLILDIFAQHAQSRAGKLQVELAQLKYNLPRLTDLDAGLSRLTGGIGGRGPGETKLEINRRRARDRIARLEREIERLSQQRALRRKRRNQSGIPVVSIVGYTNAGKSTLLNQLTQSEVQAADQLFATLDPTSRRLRFPREHEAIITDTVGFIRDLPPDLMRAFRTTLEELETADLILHVVDAADPSHTEKMKTVQEVLQDLGLESIPQIVVLNKMDRIDPLEGKALAQRNDGVLVSAQKRENLGALVQRIAAQLWSIDILPEPNSWEAHVHSPAQQAAG